MTVAEWWSQPFPPTGAIASEGIRNQLGRPPVDPLTVFVRETGQNSWDARVPGQPTAFALELTTVAPSRRPNWERLLAPPAHMHEHLGIGRSVKQPYLRLLSVVDRGTRGLGGPTRADEVSEDRRDWVSFVLNVGEKKGLQQGGGGTYGYGKAVLYRLSKVGTILVYTRTATATGPSASRLIGISLGSSFDSRTRVGEESKPFTGRHWWGEVREDHVEPLLGVDADAAAAALGLRAFEVDETGTTLVVVDPDLDEFDDDGAAARHLADTIAWQMWPILLPERGEERMAASVKAGGRMYPVPDPATSYPLRMFVSAYRDLSGTAASTLECKSPRQSLGKFALERSVVLPMGKDSAVRAAAYAGVEGDPHHVCLMRSPELVVRYLEGPAPLAVHQAYAGVFRADDELDAVYARSEPPTHDNWVPNQLEGREATFVRTTFTRLKERLSEFQRPAAGATSAVDGLALGAASNFLGGLVAAAFSPSAPPASRSSRRGQRSTRPQEEGMSRVSVTQLDEPQLVERNGVLTLVQKVRVNGDGLVRLEAKLSVATWDGREDDAPAGAQKPTVRSWSTPWGEALTPILRTTAPVVVELEVLPVPDTVTDIDVRATAVGDSRPGCA